MADTGENVDEGLDRRAGIERRQRTDAVAIDRRHGERRSYQLGCRCVQCRAANASYQQRRYADRKAGRAALGSHVPSARLHIMMKVLRIEQLSNGEVAAILGWGRNYSKFYHRSRVALRTVLKVQRLYRERVLE